MAMHVRLWALAENEAMEYRRLGGTGVKLSVVGLGTWVTFGKQVGAKAAEVLVGRALDLGIQFFDTADMYADGAAEEILGRALAGHRRSHIVLATKVYGEMGPGPNDRGLSRKHIIAACEASLRRLRTEFIDLYQCHRHDPESPLEEVIAAMDHLVHQGKVLYWGVSQWTAVQIAECVHLARAAGLTPPRSNQPIYNLFNRSLEVEVLRTCENLGLGVVCYSPLAQGILTGKYSRGKRPPGTRAADKEASVFMQKRMTAENLERADRLRELGRSLGLTAAQLALAWCLRLQAVTSVIVGARTVAQLKENSGAAGVSLTPETEAQLEKIFASAPHDQYTGLRVGYGHEPAGW
jgi:voltage-dependent potassium channel beta subunit